MSKVEAAIRSLVTKGVSVLAEINRERRPQAQGPHPFLTGLHAPMTEERTVEDLAVTGEIPLALDGRYLRIGPNPIDADARNYHWFLGDGMVHGLRLQGGRARWYRNRWIRSEAVSAALGEPAVTAPPGRERDVVNTNVLGFAGQTWAIVEAGTAPARLSEALETLAYDDFDGTLAGAFSAHPHFDPSTGELHAIAYHAHDQAAVRHVVVTPDGRVRREEPVEVSHGPSIHDCAITERYVLIFDLPVTFSMGALIGGHPFPYRWNTRHRARVGLLPREGRGDEAIWCDVDPCYVFHVANAYDAPDGRVVVDLVAHETMFADSEQGPDSRRSALERWIIDPQARRVDRKVVDARPQEFPRTDERSFGRRHRYVYTMRLPDVRDPAFVGATSLLKHDLEMGSTQTCDFGSQRYPGEFVFVPAHPGAAEDEGWLMGLVVDMVNETTDLVILDARNFEGPPRASVRIPHRVPAGFHGNWAPTNPWI
jgi:carotenoid cleavage dioxygenase